MARFTALDTRSGRTLPTDWASRALILSRINGWKSQSTSNCLALTRPVKCVSPPSLITPLVASVSPSLITALLARVRHSLITVLLVGVSPLLIAVLVVGASSSLIWIRGQVVAM